MRVEQALEAHAAEEAEDVAQEVLAMLLNCRHPFSDHPHHLHHLDRIRA